ncbi:hypothetical protein LRP67_18490, partial [Nocardioides sp. cx-169]|nr:hypothetical protein [Nocardioides sp. cx-169]
MFDSLMRQIAETQRALADCPRALSDAQRVQLLGAAEGLKCTASAAQATTTVELDASQRQVQAAAGVPTSRLGEGIAEQVGLARHESPTKAARLLASRRSCSTRCPTPWRSCAPGGSTSGAPPSWPARPPAC